MLWKRVAWHSYKFLSRLLSRLVHKLPAGDFWADKLNSMRNASFTLTIPNPIRVDGYHMYWNTATCDHAVRSHLGKFEADTSKILQNLLRVSIMHRR